MDCSRCGLSNLPYFADCSFCDHPLRNPSEAQARKQEWDALTQGQRDEFSRTYVQDRERFDQWREKLRTDFYKHLAMGAVLFGASTTLFLVWCYSGNPFLVTLLVVGDLIWGAGIGWLINHLRGGEYRAMVAFGLSFILTNSLKLALGCLVLSLGAAFMLLFGLLWMLPLGYLFGIHLTLQRSLH